MNDLYQLSLDGITAFGNEADIDQNARITRDCRDIKMRMNGDASNTRQQDLIEATERAGSLCTRSMGAGGGGFFVCWAPAYKHESIKSAVKVRIWGSVKFSSTGCQLIFRE